MSTQPKRPRVVVIDPAMRIAEVECFNQIALDCALPCTYHLPAMWGMQSLEAEDMTQAAGIVILGSASSVNDRLPWQGALEEWLRPHLARKVPTLGICYGHQMLAYMFGGRVDYVVPERTKLKGFRTVEVEGTPCWPAGRGGVVVSHNETVVEAPREMRVVAKSAEIAVDGLAHATLPVFTFQPHPEATPEFLKNHGIPPAADAAALRFGQSLVRGFLAFAAKNAARP